MSGKGRTTGLIRRLPLKELIHQCQRVAGTQRIRRNWKDKQALKNLCALPVI